MSIIMFALCRKIADDFIKENLAIVHMVQKNAFQASAAREIGNNHFAQREIAVSLEFYNDSLIVAPYESVEYALALSNRSVAFLEMQEYEVHLILFIYYLYVLWL